MKAIRCLSFYAVFLSACGSPPTASAPSTVLGKAVELTLPTNHGLLGTLPAQGAASTVADFFAPTCAPCKKTLPLLYARKKDIEAAGGRLVLVAVLADSESTEDARKALASWLLPGVPFLVDAADSSRREAGVRTLPTTLVMDAKGMVVWSAPPEATADDVVRAARSAAAR